MKNCKRPKYFGQLLSVCPYLLRNWPLAVLGTLNSLSDFLPCFRSNATLKCDKSNKVKGLLLELKKPVIQS